MSYDLGVLNLKGGKRKKRKRLWVAVGVVVVVVVAVVARLVLR